MSTFTRSNFAKNHFDKKPFRLWFKHKGKPLFSLFSFSFLLLTKEEREKERAETQKKSEEEEQKRERESVIKCFLSDEQTFFFSLWPSSLKREQGVSSNQKWKILRSNTHASLNRKFPLSSHQSDSRLRYSRQNERRGVPSLAIMTMILRCRPRRNDCTFMFAYIEMMHLSSSPTPYPLFSRKTRDFQLEREQKT